MNMKDIIRERTPAFINKEIDAQTLRHLDRYRHASAEEIEERLKMLDRQWDVESVVAMTGAVVSIGGLLLGMRNRKLLAIPMIAQGLVLSHSLPIPDPVTPIFRAFGLWSRHEIERERHALKLLRGDYERVEHDDSPKSVLSASQGERGIKEATAPSDRMGGLSKGKPRERRATENREPLGEELRPTDVPTVSGPSGNPEGGPRLH